MSPAAAITGSAAQAGLAPATAKLKTRTATANNLLRKRRTTEPRCHERYDIGPSPDQMQDGARVDSQILEPIRGGVIVRNATASSINPDVTRRPTENHERWKEGRETTTRSEQPTNV